MSIDISKDGAYVVVSGLGEKVAEAMVEMERFVCDHEEKEDVVPIDKYLARVLMDESGALLKELRKVTGCGLFVDMQREAEEGNLTVRGQTLKLAEAVAEVRRAVAAIKEKTLEVVVDPEMVKYIIGRKGVVINALREKTRAMIEADMRTGRICVYHPEAAVREVTRSEIMNVVEKNQAAEVVLTKEAAICLKGSKGQGLRDQCAAPGLEVHLDIDANKGLVWMRGGEAEMETVRGLLLAFAEQNYGVEMDLPQDDYMMLVAGEKIA